MNTNRLYLVGVYAARVGHYINENGLIVTKILGDFLKPTVVYHTLKGNYVDLLSNEKYILGKSNVEKTGDMYIKLTSSIIPVHDVFDINFSKQNMSKKRVIKELSKSKVKEQYTKTS